MSLVEFCVRRAREPIRIVNWVWLKPICFRAPAVRSIDPPTLLPPPLHSRRLIMSCSRFCFVQSRCVFKLEEITPDDVSKP